MRADVRPSVRAIVLGALAIMISGCSTRIHEKNETILPSKVPFAQFSKVVVVPLLVERSGNDSGDQRAIEHIKDGLARCFDSVFKTVTHATPGQSTFTSGTLVIEPAIEDLKKVNGAERFWVGPIAGSSAVLLRTRYRDGNSGDMIASPVFYSKANAMGGTWTFGATDNAMLTRVVDLACDYARRNQ